MSIGSTITFSIMSSLEARSVYEIDFSIVWSSTFSYLPNGVMIVIEEDVQEIGTHMSGEEIVSL